MMSRLVGLVLVSAAVGLSPLLAGAFVQARGRAGAQSVERVIAVRDVPVPPKLSRGPHLPKGCWLQLENGHPARWSVLLQRPSPLRAALPDEPPERVIKLVRRLRPGKAAWILEGSAPPLDIRWPRYAQARRLLRLESTGYDPGPVDNTRGWVGSTRSGERARFGIVAVDPRIIPLGSRVYVEGYGPALAADVGGAIKGPRIDLCFNSTHQARAWGRRSVRVWIVDPVPSRDLEAFRSVLSGR
jgi:3D (Asp-Asp-Asp) domain-containing protein